MANIATSLDTEFLPSSGVGMAKDIDDEYWRKRWVNDQVTFHSSELNPTLVKYIDKMTAGQDKCRIFVPLCGKSKDMKWLADQGHIVVGAELSSIAIQDFFKENNVEYSSSPVNRLNDAELYASKNSSIFIYEANLFDLNREILGEFDCIWDRASLVALVRDDMQRYVDLMKTIHKPIGGYLLVSLEYDQSKMNGPPFSTPLDTVEQLYGADWDIEFLEVFDGMNDKWRRRGLSAVTGRTHLLTKREVASTL